MAYRNGADAGRTLAIEVGRRFGIPDVVAAVSMDGGVVAQSVARAFARPLVFAYCEPLFLPWRDEREPVFGAVSPDGLAVLDYAALASFRLSTEEIEAARARTLREIEDFYARNPSRHIDSVLPAPRVLLVDDELSVGWRMEAALAFVRRRGVARVLVAGAFASPAEAAWLSAEADGFVALEIGEPAPGPDAAGSAQRVSVASPASTDSMASMTRER
jgi:predicted phosphoribosyltransferase